MVWRGEAWVLVGESVLFNPEVGRVRLKGTEIIVRRVAWLQVVAWVHLGQRMQGCERRGGRQP